MGAYEDHSGRMMIGCIYGLFRVKHPTVVVAGGLKKGNSLLSAITDRQLAPHMPHKSHPHGHRSQLHNSHLKMDTFPSHSPAAGLRKTHTSGAKS